MPALERGASCEFPLESTTLSLFSARGSASAWTILRISLKLTAVWRALPRGASSEFFSESATLSLFGVAGFAGAGSVLRILLGMDDPLVVLGERRWRVERLENSFGNGRPSLGFGRLAALVLVSFYRVPKTPARNWSFHFTQIKCISLDPHCGGETAIAFVGAKVWLQRQQN